MQYPNSILRFLRKKYKEIKENKTLQDGSEVENESGEVPLCESLIDLQLTAEERDTVPAEQRETKKAHFYVWCNSPCNSLQVNMLKIL